MRKTSLCLALSFLFWCGGVQAASARHRPLGILMMNATAFTHAHQPTASGTQAHEGIVAADPHVLPLGSRIRIHGTDGYNGEYLVTDTGQAIRGHRIDVYLRSRAEAIRFGIQRVRVEILRLGKGRADARAKDSAPPPPSN